MYNEECGSETIRSGKKWGKSETIKRSGEIGKSATWWFRDLYMHIHRSPSASPHARKKRYCRHREVLRRPRIHNWLKLYLYMFHTHIHRPVKAGTTWLCLSWKQFCMEHMSTPFYYRLRTDYPSPTSFFETIILPTLSESFSTSQVSFLSFHFFFLFLRQLKTHACM